MSQLGDRFALRVVKVVIFQLGQEKVVVGKAQRKFIRKCFCQDCSEFAQSLVCFIHAPKPCRSVQPGLGCSVS